MVWDQLILEQLFLLIRTRTTSGESLLVSEIHACLVFYVIVYFLTAVDCDERSLNCLTQSKVSAYGMTCV